MEVNQKKNSGLIVLFILLILCVIGLAGYIVYDKSSIGSGNIESKSTTTTTTIVKGNEISEVSVEQRYANYLENLKNELQKEFTDKDSEISLSSDSMYIDNGYNFIINKNLNLYMSISDSKYKDKYNNYKIDSNVLSMFVIYTGNGGFKTLYYITSEGKVKSMCIDCIQSGEPQVKEEKYNNIVNIIQGDYDISTSVASSPIFVDINGNIFTD